MISISYGLPANDAYKNSFLLEWNREETVLKTTTTTKSIALECNINLFQTLHSNGLVHSAHVTKNQVLNEHFLSKEPSQRERNR